MYREIPSLSSICYKFISKVPTSCINEKYYQNIQQHYSISLIDKVTQQLIYHITDSGRMSDNIIPPIVFHSNITSIILKNSKITANYLYEILVRCPNLLSLDISSCLIIDDEILLKILQYCIKLNHLNIRNCRKLTNLSLQYLIQYGGNIHSLNIGGNYNITEDGIYQLIEKHPNHLQFLSLNLSGLPITENTLHLLAIHCPNLKSLGLGYALIHEIILYKYLTSNGGKLESLNISWLTPPYSHEGVSIEILDQILKTCPKLQILDISGLKSITSTALNTFIDTKRTKADFNPAEYEKMKLIIAKFITGTKAQLDSIAAQYPELTIET